MIDQPLNRRRTFAVLGGAATLLATPVAGLAQTGGTGTRSTLLPGSGALAELSRRLRAAPRRRSFDTVPFMIDRRELWDHEASDLLLSYRGDRKQMWESSDIGAPWLNLMREAMNGQVFAHGHPDFLPVAAVHGTAHLALFNQAMWDRYGLAKNAGGQILSNAFVAERAGVSPADDRQKVDGFYGSGNNNISTLQRRGAVMVACHDSIHAIARGIVSKAGSGSPDTIAADLTNNLIDDVVLVPSVVAYLVELQAAGFTYAKAS
jgi:intracellular sulfur oxidation DsrE/DsrF family protein